VSSEHADRETVKDLVAVVNRLEDRVEKLDVRLRELELQAADREVDNE
jgi:predicted oxidoreductase